VIGTRRPEVLIASRDDDAANSNRGQRQSAKSLCDKTEAFQLKLPGYEDVPSRPPKRRHRYTPNTQAIGGSSLDPLIEIYLRRLRAHGAAKNGFDAYRYQLRAITQIAARRKDRAVLIEELFHNTRLLGEVLVDDVAPVAGSQLSKWTLAQRRSAIRSFATLMRPELLATLGEEPNMVVDQALRKVAIRVGGGYRLTGGSPRYKGGDVPTPDEVQAVLRALGETPGYLGLRNWCFFSILAASGARVNALRELDGADCVEMPSGRMRIFIHDKGKHEPREVELSRELTATLQAYVAEFNAYAARRAWKVRIRIGQPGAVWRNSGRGHWSYYDIRQTLAAACKQTNIALLRPHAFRRAFATGAASVVPRHVVAQAGGWQGVERLDNHYIRPDIRNVVDKLHRRRQHETMPSQNEEHPDGTAILVRSIYH